MWRDAAADIHPPAYYWLLKAWTAAAGRDAWAMRSLSALLGVLLVLVVYRIGLHLPRRSRLHASAARRPARCAGPVPGLLRARSARTCCSLWRAQCSSGRSSPSARGSAAGGDLPPLLGYAFAAQPHGRTTAFPSCSPRAGGLCLESIGGPQRHAGAPSPAAFHTLRRRQPRDRTALSALAAHCGDARAKLAQRRRRDDAARRAAPHLAYVHCRADPQRARPGMALACTRRGAVAGRAVGVAPIARAGPRPVAGRAGRAHVRPGPLLGCLSPSSCWPRPRPGGC